VFHLFGVLAQFDGRSSGTGRWPGWRRRGPAGRVCGPVVQAVRGAAPAGPADVRRAGADGGADRRRAGGEPHLDLPGVGQDDSAGIPRRGRTGRHRTGGRDHDVGRTRVSSGADPATETGRRAPVVVRSRAGSWCRPTRPIPSADQWRWSAATPARRLRPPRWAGPEPGVVGWGGSVLQVRAAGQIRFPAGAGQPGQAGGRAARAAARTARLTAVRPDLLWWP
jgi:hypothetical protein